MTFIASGEKYTVKGTDDGSTYAKVDANYVKYGDETIALTADTVVTDGYVSVTIDDAEAVYKTTGDADVDSLKAKINYNAYACAKTDVGKQILTSMGVAL